jgi:hypothetical protein
MLFFSDKLEKNAPKIEAKLRKELGAGQPLAWQSEAQGSFRPDTLGGLARELFEDAAAKLKGQEGGFRPLYTVRFDVPQPRPIEVRVAVVNAKNRVVLGPLFFATRLPRRLAGAVRLQDEDDAGLFGRRKFEGDAALAEKLNGDKALVKMANRLSRSKYALEKFEIEGPCHFRLSPDGDGTLLTVSTMARSTWFGMGSAFDAKDFLAIATALEAALPAS